MSFDSRPCNVNHCEQNFLIGWRGRCIQPLLERCQSIARPSQVIPSPLLGHEQVCFVVVPQDCSSVVVTDGIHVEHVKKQSDTQTQNNKKTNYKRSRFSW